MPKPRLIPLTTLPDHAHLRPDQVARFLDISLSHVYVLVRDGEIPSLKLGKSVRIPRAAFLTWHEDSRHNPLSPSSLDLKLSPKVGT